MKIQIGNNGFFGLLTLLFIGLKLGGVISWSWWWILSPMLFSVAFFFVAVLIAIVFAYLS